MKQQTFARCDGHYEKQSTNKIRAPVLRDNGETSGDTFMRRFTNDYNPDGKLKRQQAREAAGNKCIRCGSPSVPGKILTTHHFDGNKANDEWWNLLALCQVCHLQIQGKVDPETPWFLEHSTWIKPYVAGFYASKYEGKNLTRQQVTERLDELLAYELRTK